VAPGNFFFPIGRIVEVNPEKPAGECAVCDAAIELRAANTKRRSKPVDSVLKNQLGIPGFVSLSATRIFVLIRQCAHAVELLRSGVDMSGGHENFAAVVGDQLEQFKC
jgi:hypothetical protein